MQKVEYFRFSFHLQVRPPISLLSPNCKNTMPPPPPASGAAAAAADENPRGAKRTKVDVDGEIADADALSYEGTRRIADGLMKRTKHRPTLLIICGSGLGGLAEDLTDTQCVHPDHQSAHALHCTLHHNTPHHVL
jgi:hypothetical protein